MGCVPGAMRMGCVPEIVLIAADGITNGVCPRGDANGVCPRDRLSNGVCPRDHVFGEKLCGTSHDAGRKRSRPRVVKPAGTAARQA